MIRSWTQRAEWADRSWDSCVLGSGAAGISLAKQLHEAGKTVLVLEAGNATVENSNQDMYKAEVDGSPVHQGVHHGRYITLGGTTTRWGGQIAPLGTIDFQSREWVEGSGWPLQIEALEPYYRQALEIEGLEHAIATDDAVWAALSQVPADAALPDIDRYFTRWCTQPDFARLHRDILEAQRGPSILLGARATALRWRGSRVEAVRAVGATGSAEFRARNVVIATGGMESVRLMLHSAFQPPSMPSRAKNRIGTNFQDHVDVNVGEVLTPDWKKLSVNFSNVFVRNFKYQPKVMLSGQSQRTAEVLGAAASIVVVDEHVDRAKEMLRQWQFGRHIASPWPALRDSIGVVWPMTADLVSRRVAKRSRFARSGRVFVRAHLEQPPLNSNRLSLSNEVDGAGMHVLKVSWSAGDEELSAARTLFRCLRKEQHRLGLTSLAPLPALDSLRQFQVAARDANHHMGGLAMAEGAQGVVDSHLLVNGAENLYICSAAVFPTSGFANPTHTVVALALRLAKHLVDRGDHAR